MALLTLRNDRGGRFGPLNGSGSLERVVHGDCWRTRDTDRRSDPLDLRVPLEESPELLCGFPLIDDDELVGASDESVMKNSSALGVLGDLFEERSVCLQTFDGFVDVGNREVNDGCDTHVDTSDRLVDHPD